MSRSLPTIWAIGVLVIAAAQVAWFLLLQTETYSQIFFILLWSSPGIAALIVSFLSPRRKVLMGFSLLLPASILIAILDHIHELAGQLSDFPGLHGAWLLFAIALAWNAVTCGIGTTAGYLLSRGRQHQS